MPSSSRLFFERQSPEQQVSELWESITQLTAAMNGQASVLFSDSTVAVPDVLAGPVELAAANPDGQVVEVENTGTTEIMVRIGTLPGTGPDFPDQGELVEPGEVWTSTYFITQAVNAVSDEGNSNNARVRIYSKDV